MNQNVRISLYIVIPIIFWMLSGIFVEEKGPALVEDNNAASIEIRTSTPSMFSPSIKLKATSNSERRVAVKAKTTGEVVEIGAKEGDFVKRILFFVNWALLNLIELKLNLLLVAISNL